MSDAKIYAGFSQPAQDSQRAFRATMDAMARPGTIEPTPVPITAPSPLDPTAAMLALTLCDFDSPIWLDETFAANADVSQFFSFHTSAPVVQDKSEAQFAFFSSFESVGDIAQLAQGSDEYPDRSTTLIIQVDELSANGDISLKGPGIETTASLNVRGAPLSFWEMVQQNNRLFPRGVDFIFAAPNKLVCLPRSTKVTILEEAL